MQGHEQDLKIVTERKLVGLSTVKKADQIIVVDGEKIVETGNHASLIEKKGAYYNLVKNQLELGN